MEKIITLAFISLSIFGNAQDTSVEKTVFGIQTGFLGLWIHNESKLSNSIALRSELGIGLSGFWAGSSYDKIGFTLTPGLTLEPRFYYNLKKRNSELKDITNNSGNFFSLKTSYQPDWFVISNYKDVNLNSIISIVPTWGIRRNIGIHFNYEAGLGYGYGYIFETNTSVRVLNLHLRIGYVF